MSEDALRERTEEKDWPTTIYTIKSGQFVDLSVLFLTEGYELTSYIFPLQEVRNCQHQHNNHYNQCAPHD